MDIQLRDLSLTLDRKPIVDGIDLELSKKAFIGIIGPNGSGKSTILKTIYRALKKTRGEILFDGVPLEHIPLKESAKKLGVMSQIHQLPFDFSVLDLVLMGRTPHKGSMELDNAADMTIAMDALRAVDMSDFAQCSFHLLSGGEQQRVLLARVLTGEPQTVLLDELTNHLDIHYQFKVLNIIKGLHIEVLAVMHDLNLAARYCSKLYVLKSGRFIASGTPKEVLTEDLICSVFGVRSKISVEDDGFLHIRFLDVC